MQQLKCLRKAGLGYGYWIGLSFEVGFFGERKYRSSDKGETRGLKSTNLCRYITLHHLWVHVTG